MRCVTQEALALSQGVHYQGDTVLFQVSERHRESV
jgi:hypothetical protein